MSATTGNKLRKHIGRSLQSMRKRAGFKSAKQFAEAVGINPNTYTQYEQGLTGFSFDTAITMADALNCSLDELGGRDWPPSSHAYTDERQRLINHAFSTLNDAGKSQALMMVNTVATSSLYTGGAGIVGDSATASRTA